MTQEIKGNYEGYLWKSDSPAPEICHKGKVTQLTLTDGENPFIIEGELFDATSGESVSIRFIDGKYRVSSFAVAPKSRNDSDAHVTKKEYLAQRMPGIDKLCYLQYWEPASDELCENMEVLQPDRLVFVGFKKKEEK